MARPLQVVALLLVLALVVPCCHAATRRDGDKTAESGDVASGDSSSTVDPPVEQQPVPEFDLDSAAMKDARDAQRVVDNIQHDMMEELNKIEKEFTERRGPLQMKRNDLLQGIKGFWGRVLMRHPARFQWSVDDMEKDILTRYLTDLRVEELDSSPHHQKYRITMTFATNTYFVGTKLTRTVVNGRNENAEVSGVKWRAGRAPAEKSFFNLFEPKDARSDVLSEPELQTLTHILRYDVWPNPFTYFDASDSEHYRRMTTPQPLHDES